MPTDCPVCTCWDMDKDTELLDYAPPDGCPAEMLGLSGKLRPKQMSYSSLSCAAKLAHARIISGDWGYDAGVSYLCSEGYQPSYAKCVAQNAHNTKKYDE